MTQAFNLRICLCSLCLLALGCNESGATVSQPSISNSQAGGGAQLPSAAAGATAAGSSGSTAPSVPTAGRSSNPVAGAMAAAAGTGTGSSAGAAGRNTAGTGAAGSAGSAGAAGAAGAAAPMNAAGAGGTKSTGSMLPPASDYAQKGPFKTTMTANTGPGSNYTIFRPEPLGENGFLHSPIIFGPGILTTASTYRTMLDHFASHGFVTICVNSMSGGPGAPGNLEAMKSGLEWLIAQNAAAGVFEHKLATDRAITMGYSIGATASVQLSSHESIATSVIIHGHNTSGNPHGPVLMITGTMDVIDDMRRTLTTLEEAPAVLVALPIGHLNVLTEIAATGRYIAPITAWLRYWANGDEAAKRYFWGDGCDMCKSPWIPPEPNAKWKAQML